MAERLRRGAGPSVTDLVLSPDERAGLTVYLGRLVGLDNRGSIRLQASGLVLGVWGGPPLDVVTLRPVALSVPLELDVTVSAQRLLDRLQEAASDSVLLPDSVAASNPVPLPDSVSGPAWAGLLPPRGGWSPLATVPASSVFDAVRVGIEAFGRRVALLREEQRTRAALDAVAADVWNRPVVAGVPLRAAHAAELTGLLGREGEVTAFESPTWQRLSCPGGSVALRKDSGSGLALGVWALGR